MAKRLFRAKFQVSRQTKSSLLDQYTTEDLIGNGDDDVIETGSAGTRFLEEHPLERSGRRLLSKSDMLISFQSQGAIGKTVRSLNGAEKYEETEWKMPSSRCKKGGERAVQNKSEILSNAATDATRKMSNVDLSSPKRKFRERAQAKRMHQQQVLFCDEDTEDDQAPPDARNMGSILSEYKSKFLGRGIRFTDSLFLGGSQQVDSQCLSPTFACLSGSYGVIGADISSAQGDTTHSKVLELSIQALLLGTYEKEWRLAKKSDKLPSSAQHGLNTRDASCIQSRCVYSADGQPFLGLTLTGSLGLLGLDVASPIHCEKDYLILRVSSTGVPLAVCALKSPYEEPVVRIYATKPCIGSQISAASSSDIGIAGPSVDLYAFAEFRAEGSFPFPVRYSVYLSAGEEGTYEKEPKYKGSHPTPGSPNVTFVGRPGKESVYRGCCLLTVGGSEECANQSRCQISMSKGIDPAIFVCLVAIIDEVAMWRQPPKKFSRRRQYV